MVRVLLTASFTALVATGALAKDLCLEVQGKFENSVLVLKTGRLGKGSFGPVHGYFALNDVGVTNEFIDFYALDGQALVSSQGDLVLGLFTHEATLPATGFHTANGGFDAINLGCAPGPDGKPGLGDLCDGYVFNVSEGAEVISCKDAPKLP
jgi:hypothetical protein